MNKTCTFGIDAETFGVLTPSGAARKNHLVTVSGVPPLTVRHAKVAVPKSITIYGNTVDSVGVGDRTSNLFDKEHYNILNSYISGARLIYMQESKTIYIPCMPDTTYTVSKIESARFAIGCSSAVAVSNGNITVPDYLYSTSTTKTITTSADAQYLIIWLYNGQYDISISLDDILSSLYIGLGSAFPGYEPYGFKLPIVFTSASNEQTRLLVYLSAPLYIGDTHTITDFGDTILYNGSNSISVNTTVQPSSLDISYSR